MPLPTPSGDESESEFIGRCMHDVQGEFDSQEQRLAVCYSQWRRGSKMEHSPTTRAELVAAAKSGGQRDDLLVRKALVPETVEPVEGSDRRVRFVISTGAVDRDGDTINPNGWDVRAYIANPVVLWAHDYKSLPLAKAVSVEVRDGKLVSECEFADHEFANTVHSLIKGGFLRATSVGFKPTKFKAAEERGGIDFDQQELMEWSIVPVPANPEALIDMRAAKAAGINVEPLVAWAKAVMAATAPPVAKVVAPVVIDAPEDPLRWNPALSKAFDVDGEPAEPSTQLYKWVSRYLATPVKDLFETGFVIGGARMGAFLSAVDDVLGSKFKTEAVRNIRRNENGTATIEAPPTYETVQLNSKRSRSFLIEGTRFLTPLDSDSTKLVLRVQPTWGGVAFDWFAPNERAEAAEKVLSEVSALAASYKFLKGEAFALSGEFLTRGGETWDDLFLAPAALDPIKRMVALLNEQGSTMDPRGVILMGPPGTGKTLAGRIVMNETKDVTFIWCSSRDFYRSGMFGGLTMAYDLAADNAPTVVFIEDIDSWWDPSTIDMLKTELDGLKQKRGIVTVLTTNTPENLPEALIDRPGRFHDVLNLGLPDEAVRLQMLQKWAPDADQTVRTDMAKRTEGLSGAHLRELVRFAQTIRSQDGVDLAAALEQALAKVLEQREVIGSAQTRRRSVSAFKAVYKAPKLPQPPTCKPDKEGQCPAGYAMGRDGMCHLGARKDEPDVLDLVEAAPCRRPRMAKVTEVMKDIDADLLAALQLLDASLVAVDDAFDSVLDKLGAADTPAEPEQPKPETPAQPATPAAAEPDAQKEPTAVAPAAEGQADPFVLDLDDAPCEEVAVELENDVEDESVLDVSPEDVRAALRSAVTSVVGAVVREEVSAAVNRARGRVD